MDHPLPNHPLQVQDSPSLIVSDLEPLLADPFAAALALDRDEARVQVLRERLGRRINASLQAEAGMVTVRRSRTARRTVAPGVSVQGLYMARDPKALRPGEPVRVALVELAPGASIDARSLASDAGLELLDHHREWLVMSGQANCDDETLALRDYRVFPAGHATARWSSETGALLFLRESLVSPRDTDGAHTVRDADAGWPDFAPGIQRRVLWQRDGQAALLYYAQPGAQVPRHIHGHDEECLMLQGELFLDDLLLQAGDYQLAPAGTGHRTTETDTGVVVYAHGDLDFRFVT